MSLRIALPTALSFALGVTVTACSSSIHPRLVPLDDSRLALELRTAYSEAAAQLALQHLVASDDPAAQQVRIPQALVDELYDALVRVFYFRHPARDSVIEVYDIHTLLDPEIRQLLVSVDPTHPWVQAWQRGERLTGNEQIDQLLGEFDLDLADYTDLRALSYDFAVLDARTPLNMAALAVQFQGISGVVNVGPNFAMFAIGDSDHIEARREESGWLLDYSVGYGDCPASCIYRRFWTFRVADDGTVAFLGSRGDPAPPPDRDG